MTQFYAFVVAVFLCAASLQTLPAQQPITITLADMPNVGDVPYFSVADTLLMVEAGPGGANLNWDFSHLTPISQRRDSFISVPFLYQAFFFGADVARFIDTPDSLGNISVDIAYEFYNKSSSRFENMGMGFEVNGIPISLKNDPRDVVYRFPLTYGHTDTSHSVAQLDLTSFGINLFYRREQTRINEADAWGSLTTPYGTFNALRVKTQITARDSLAFDTTNFAITRPLQTTYNWLTNGEGVPMLSINQFRIGGTDQVVSVSYRDSIRSLNNVGIFDSPQKTQLQAGFYPNPARDHIELQLEAALGTSFTLEIMDLNGRVLRRQQLHARQLTVPVHTLPPGLYLLRVRTQRKQFTGKLLIEAR
ncbi:MAG: T9SS C-terminal target domain-containing protein [Bacteroidetes bacterium]|nr:MAG: T9SS C-terminal target domain-containing protein [Bacteroidota bacterium]